MGKDHIPQGSVLLPKSTELHLMTSRRGQISPQPYFPSSNMLPQPRIHGEAEQFGCPAVRDHKIAGM